MDLWWRGLARSSATSGGRGDDEPPIDADGREVYRHVEQRAAHRDLVIRWPNGETGPAQSPPSFPPVTTQIGNALGALERATGQLLSGNALLVSPEEFERRLTICGVCDQYRDGRCLRCGCKVDLKARLESETGHCPKGKW
jgi:Family of unknown function (DUF6171)